MTNITSAIPVDWTNVTTFDQFIHNANTSGAGYLFPAIDFLVFMVLFITMTGLTGSWESAILSSGFIGIILTLLFAYMGVMSWWFSGAFIAILIVAIMYVIWSNKFD